MKIIIIKMNYQTYNISVMCESSRNFLDRELILRRKIEIRRSFWDYARGIVFQFSHHGSPSVREKLADRRGKHYQTEKVDKYDDEYNIIHYN